MSTKEFERAESTGTASGSGDDVDGNDPSIPKTCIVCSDRALSCNFGAITCESCKAFFRRNAAKDWTSKCDGTCPITVETRSYCKKCRLAKCFEVGMNKGLILTDEQKRLRKQKILENKVRRGSVSGLPDVCLVGQETLGMGIPSLELPRSAPLPIRCPPHPSQGLNMNPQPAFLPFQSEKLTFDRSTVNSMGSQTSFPSQIHPSDKIVPHEQMSSPTGGTPDKLYSVDSIMYTKLDQGLKINTADSTQPSSTHVSEGNQAVSSGQNAPLGEPYVEVVSQDQSPPFVKEYSPDSKKHRISSSGLSPQSCSDKDSSSSMQVDSSSQSNDGTQGVLQQTGIVCTTLKILMDSESFKLGLQNLVSPIIVPNYHEIFNHPALRTNDVQFANHMHQLERATTCAFGETKKHNKCPKDPNYTQIFNFSETSIKCLVKMAKNLDPFMKLNTDDQIVMLKNSILEMMVLGSAASYEPQEKAWHVMDGTEVKHVSTQAVKSSRDGLILMCHYEMIILCVLSATKRDLGLLTLLTMLSLFSTKTQRVPLQLLNKAKVDSGYQLYWNILQQYVLLKYPTEEETMIHNLAKASDIVRDFSETYIQSILKLPFDKINPLLLEIFDLPYA